MVLYKVAVALLSLVPAIAGGVLTNATDNAAYLFAGIARGAILAFLLLAFIKRFENIAVIARNSDRTVAYLQAIYAWEQPLVARSLPTAQSAPIAYAQPAPAAGLAVAEPAVPAQSAPTAEPTQPTATFISMPPLPPLPDAAND